MLLPRSIDHRRRAESSSALGPAFGCGGDAAKSPTGDEGRGLRRPFGARLGVTTAFPEIRKRGRSLAAPRDCLFGPDIVDTNDHWRRCGRAGAARIDGTAYIDETACIDGTALRDSAIGGRGLAGLRAQAAAFGHASLGHASVAGVVGAAVRS